MTAGSGGLAHDDGAVVTAQSLFTLARCERRLWLDTHDPSGKREPTEFERDLRDRSRDHQRWFRSTVSGRVGPLWRYGDPVEPAAREALRLLRETRAPLDQAPLLSRDGERLGVPDLLYWDGDGLVICDARLAESVLGKPEIALQLSHFAELLEESAGITPARLEIFSGRGERLTVPRLSPEAYARAVQTARRVMSPDAAQPSVLLSHSDCEACPYYEPCWKRAETEGRIQVLPSVRRNLMPILESLGIRTMEDLAGREPESLMVKGIGRYGPPMVHDARAFVTGEPQWLNDPGLPSGRPCVWFDLESDPQDEQHGTHVYLWGLAVEPEHGEARAEGIQSRGDSDSDEDTWRRFLARAGEILDRWPESCWVHYSITERTGVKKYVERWGDTGGVAERLLARLFDLHGDGVMKCVRLPIRAYGIKHVARHLGFEWSAAASGSQWSVAEYRRAQNARDLEERDRLLAGIARYNADDLWAMRAVWRWLEAHAEARNRAKLDGSAAHP